jgi:iron complex transport system ATP-binding protein
MLVVENVTLAYGPRRVLHGVSLAVRPGEVLALVGPNGAGKSTVLRACAGELAPVAGRITVGGAEIAGLAPVERARRVAVVPQAARLPEGFTALETVLMGRTAYLGWFSRERSCDRAIVHRALERTCTAELADRPIGELSGGEQQRVLLARALAQEAPLLLLDEPTAHLDLRHQAGVLALVRDLARREGRAVLLALHDLNLAAQYADRLALLADGRLRAEGAPDEVLTPAHLAPAYGVPFDVHTHPRHGTPWVLSLT